MNIFAWVIMLAIIVFPIVVSLLLHKALRKTYKITSQALILPVICGLLYPIARALREPHITNESITLAQHFVGGGFISTLYFVYFIREFNIKLPSFAYILLLYPFVSMMGVTNELLEFASTKLGIYAVDGTDTWWDLLANTLGAYCLFILILILLKSLQISLLRAPGKLGTKK